MTTQRIPSWNRLYQTIGVEGIMDMVRTGTWTGRVTETGTCTFVRELEVTLSLDEVIGEGVIQDSIDEGWDESQWFDWFYDNANIVDEALNYGETVSFETDNEDGDSYDWHTRDNDDLMGIIRSTRAEAGFED